MTPNEMSDLVKANIDRIVKVIYGNGQTDLGLAQSVDDEGFVYDLASLAPDERKTSYWTAFSEVEKIEPVVPS